MGTTPIKRCDLGAGTEGLIAKGDFRNLLMEDINGKKVVYRDCDFSYSVFIRGYFHNAKFERCTFVGTRFVTTNFRSATFEGCDFRYADFDRCVVPIPQLLANLPTHANERWDLLHNLRANGRAIGDTNHEPELVWQEIETEIEHWRAIILNHAGYYKKNTPFDRLDARFRYWRLLTERYVWGHGESLLRLGMATCLALAMLALLNAIGRLGDLDRVSIGVIGSQWLNSFCFITTLFIDLPSVDSSEVAASPITSTLAVVLRYVSIGLAVPVLYKYIAKR